MKVKLLIATIIIGSLHSLAQNTVDSQIKEIRKEYGKITGNLDSYEKKEVYYSNEDAYWMNVEYTGYFNNSKKLVYLTYEFGEEGYGSEVQYYFKNDQVFFIFIESIDPEENITQERIYFWNKKIIKALIKEKRATDDRTFAKIPNKKHVELLTDINKSSKIKLSGVELDRTQFFSALKKDK